MKGHISGADDNIKHMTNRMVKSIPNRKNKIEQSTQDKTNISRVDLTIES
jgi:hypothetical protein